MQNILLSIFLIFSGYSFAYGSDQTKLNNPHSYVLAIIDMQESFLREWFYNFERHALSEDIKREIHEAMTDNAWIVFVEFGEEKTTPELLNQTAGYDKIDIVKKYDLSGAEGILASIERNNVSYDSIRVAGIFFDQCVLKTVVRLSASIAPDKKVYVLNAATRAQPYGKLSATDAERMIIEKNRNVIFTHHSSMFSLLRTAGNSVLIVGYWWSMVGIQGIKMATFAFPLWYVAHRIGLLRANPE
ncbi:MAG: isochorismatase family protein [Oligoflexales bacterium]|nr:isochorismatase family protein [Oligoflexales bacterium]